MNDTSELELKVQELQDLPAHILGLDGWILRSLPPQHRVRFLKSYEKTLQAAHHPDLYQNSVEKRRHELYLQAVANAIGFLTSSDVAFELAIQELPTKQNPLVRLKTRIEQQAHEITKGDEKLVETQADFARLQKQYASAQKEIEALTLARRHLENEGTFRRLKEYHDWHLQTSRTFPLFDLLSGRFSITAAKMRFTVLDKNLPKLVPDPTSADFATIAPRFSEGWTG